MNRTGGVKNGVRRGSGAPVNEQWCVSPRCSMRKGNQASAAKGTVGTGPGELVPSVQPRREGLVIIPQPNHLLTPHLLTPTKTSTPSPGAAWRLALPASRRLGG